MSAIVSDHLKPLPGYYPSHWPCECAGPRRQKVTAAPGLDIRPGETLVATTRQMGERRWPTMLICRAPGELYVQGGSQAGQRECSFGWVERIDPVTLTTIARSPDLPSGGHNWCGAIAAHANGDLYVVNGCYAHRLTPDLKIVAEHRFSTDNAHNGHVIAPDGNLIAKDIQIDPGKRSTFSVLDPKLLLVDSLTLPWNSVGRFSMDATESGAHLYVTNDTAIHRLIYSDGKLKLDADWSASYRIAGEDQSFAWDSTLGDGSAWFMDMGENAGVRDVLSVHPIGTNIGGGGGFGRPLHSAPQRVFRVSLTDAADRDVLVPFGDAGGSIIAPPLYDQQRRILVAFDLMNAKLGAWRYEGPGRLSPMWRKPFMNTNQLTLYADTGELIVDDCTPGVRWDAVVLDVETGAEKARADTGCGLSTGMWYTPGFGRDFYTSTAAGGIARLAVA